MSHHEHCHNPGTYNSNRKALFFAFLITASMIMVEVVGGFISGSLALLSDAGHMITDAGALGLALFALWFSRRPATHKNTYGFYRLEILSALINGTFLIGIAAYIFYEAYQRILNPAPVEGAIMLVVATIGLVANLLSAYILSRGGKENLNIQGALWHVVSDALSSVGVIIGGLVIYFTGFYLIDPILGFLIALIILRGALKLVFESVDILLEATPKDIDLDKIIANVRREIPAVKDIHDLHVWTISSGLRALSAHVLVDDIAVSDCSNISQRVKALLKQKFHIEHATIEFECENCQGGMICQIDQNG